MARGYGIHGPAAIGSMDTRQRKNNKLISQMRSKSTMRAGGMPARDGIVLGGAIKDPLNRHPSILKNTLDPASIQHQAQHQQINQRINLS